MMTLEEALETLNHKPQRTVVEMYIARNWVKPVKQQSHWVFEEIDIARIGLVHQLQEEWRVGDEAMDVVLHMMDQLYGLHEQMRRLKLSIARQPVSVQREILVLLAAEETPDYIPE